MLLAALKFLTHSGQLCNYHISLKRLGLVLIIHLSRTVNECCYMVFCYHSLVKRSTMLLVISIVLIFWLVDSIIEWTECWYAGSILYATGSHNLFIIDLMCSSI